MDIVTSLRVDSKTVGESYSCTRRGAYRRELQLYLERSIYSCTRRGAYRRELQLYLERSIQERATAIPGEEHTGESYSCTWRGAYRRELQLYLERSIQVCGGSSEVTYKGCAN